MIDARIDDKSHTGQIILKPNASFSWAANLYLLYSLMGISLAIGIGFATMGAWMILPYSVLELSTLAVCIYVCVKNCNRQEVITVHEHEVRVEKGIRTPSETWNFHRLWAKFLVKPAKHPWEGQTVSIASHGKELELGSFLSRRDKLQLIACLKRVVPPTS
tara:strand:- start:55523 stop:56005 length:483 start_codon:yes stop_codon:yes gene_type:complete